MKKHIQERGDEYLLSMPATLVVIAGAIHDPDASQAGSERAKRLIEQVMTTARAEKFGQLDILETMLAKGVEGARLLPLFDALVTRVGAPRVVQIVQQGLADARGDAE